jgi:NADPH-dependent 2,4-dienoyl-CoA reductase/sulfur reductase-like enzyme
MDGRIERLYADVVVVGAGPAGMAAAMRASESGARVTVVDDNTGPGGQIWRGGNSKPPDLQSALWFGRFRKAQIRMMAGAQVISTGASPRTLLVESSNGVRELQFEKLILATGSRELFLPFPGWTLPGIMGAGGLQALVKAGLPVAGKRIVVGGSGPLLLAVAAYLKKRGAKIILIAEQAGRGAIMKFAWKLGRHARKIKQAAALRLSLLRVPYQWGCWIEAANGSSRVEALHIRKGARRWRIECDCAAIAYGLCPNTELAALLGCEMLDETVKVDEWQQTSNPKILCAGELAGIGGVDLALAEGEIAGLVATGRREEASRLFRKRRSARRFANSLNETFALRPELKMLPCADTLVCRCEDVPYGKLLNYPSFRAAKLHTRCGMGPCQGRVCGPATQFLLGWQDASVRPPILAARIGSLAGSEDCT